MNTTDTIIVLDPIQDVISQLNAVEEPGEFKLTQVPEDLEDHVAVEDKLIASRFESQSDEIVVLQ